jgi:hypothetical protein
VAQMQPPTVQATEVAEGVTVYSITGDYAGHTAEIKLSNLAFMDQADSWAFTALWKGKAVQHGIAVGRNAAEALHVVVITVNGEAAPTAHVADTFVRMQAFTALGTAKGLAQCQMVIGDTQAVDRGGDHIPPMICGADINADGSCPTQFLHTTDARLTELPELEDSIVEGYTVLSDRQYIGGTMTIPAAVQSVMGAGEDVIIEHHHNGQTWNRRGKNVAGLLSVTMWPASIGSGKQITVSVARGGRRIRLDY